MSADGASVLTWLLVYILPFIAARVHLFSLFKNNILKPLLFPFVVFDLFSLQGWWVKKDQRASSLNIDHAKNHTPRFSLWETKKNEILSDGWCSKSPRVLPILRGGQNVLYWWLKRTNRVWIRWSRLVVVAGWRLAIAGCVPTASDDISPRLILK